MSAWLISGQVHTDRYRHALASRVPSNELKVSLFLNWTSSGAPGSVNRQREPAINGVKRNAQDVALTAYKKKTLEALIRRRTAPQREVERAQIALLADRATTTTAIAQVVGMSKPTVSRWRGRAPGIRKRTRPIGIA